MSKKKEQNKSDDLFTTVFIEPPKRTRKKVQVDEAPEDFNEFIVWFMQHFKTAIDRHIRRRLIPNRYGMEDVRSYIIECILKTLTRRAEVGRPIREPKLYFRKLIDYYCVEFQRMHGFIYGLPKRPRSVECEKDISKYGFVYLNSSDKTSEDSLHELGYVDATVCDVEDYQYDGYTFKGQDPGATTGVWDKLMKMALPEDGAVLECIFKMNMSVPEVSKHLGIAISTAYQRANRGMRALSGTLEAFTDTTKPSWQMFSDIEKLKDEDVDIMQFYDTNQS